jgi:hypothetical protein
VAANSTMTTQLCLSKHAARLPNASTLIRSGRWPLPTLRARPTPCTAEVPCVGPAAPCHGHGMPIRPMHNMENRLRATVSLARTDMKAA